MPVVDPGIELGASYHYAYTRDFKTQVTPNETQQSTLIVAGCYIIIIGILWHVPYLKAIIYPFKLLTVGFHEMSHAIFGVLTCAHIHSIELDPDEGGSTRMSGGIQWITLPAGYLGSSFIGAALITCGFNTNASKVASIVMAVFFLFTLWWARRNILTWVLIFGMSGLIVMFWFVAGGIALRYFVLFVGVMSCMYVLWDVIDDTIARKANASDAAAFARICGCFPSRVWGVLWLIVAFIFFAAGVIVGLVAFKLFSHPNLHTHSPHSPPQQSTAQQKADADHFLPVPGSHSGTPTVGGPGTLVLTALWFAFGLVGMGVGV
ncbi:hypothetical protein Hypma_008574 [Hypsizygus marmoreus]|uniref:Peptidase M50B-like-domain-containing protein n=1 Tax=Hypsizygus marmoreus TaxID=39966 RepID=A0A369JPU2_HYPMA|nr:hypothetical protein Hypma_008574 [Hypsizygus marmoreus]